ncbi:MAG: lipid-A-disaccharide synthase N-terminal domain-containing protein [Phycisphaerales bacterium]
MKWEPAAAMVAVVALGAWLVWGPPRVGGVALREGARLVEAQLGDVRGVIEVLEPAGGARGVGGGGAQSTTFRIVTRDGQAGAVLSMDEFAKVVGPATAERLAAKPGNPLFKLLKITSWTNVLWVLLGLGGQALFSARMLLQWIASERSGKNVITVSFWWISLIAGLILFTYFAWRQDIVGVLGQSTGLVVYARNVKLHYKSAKRAARHAARAAEGGEEQADPRDDPDPSAVPMVEMPTDTDRPAKSG